MSDTQVNDRQTTPLQLSDDDLISDARLRRRWDKCSAMRLWRMRKRGELPPPIKLGRENYTRLGIIRKREAGFVAA